MLPSKRAGAFSDALKWALLVCGILDFDVDMSGPHCIVPWTWHHDLTLQFLLPIGVRDAKENPCLQSAIGVPFDSIRLLLLVVQCALVNCVQYLLACALLGSPLKGSRFLRFLIQAPDHAEVTSVGMPCMFVLGRSEPPLRNREATSDAGAPRDESPDRLKDNHVHKHRWVRIFCSAR
jgi:hypothetical protein